MNYTHRMVTSVSSAGDVSNLSRTTDGIVIGIRDGWVVRWGEEPATRTTRHFSTREFAIAYLRKVADSDAVVMSNCALDKACIEDILL